MSRDQITGRQKPQNAASQIPENVSQQEVRRHKERRARELLCRFAYGEVCQRSVFTSKVSRTTLTLLQKESLTLTAAESTKAVDKMNFSAFFRFYKVAESSQNICDGLGALGCHSWAKLTASNPPSTAAHFFSSSVFLVPHQYFSASTIMPSIHEQHVY